MLITSRFVGSFDEFAVLESGSGAYQSDEVRCVDGAPSGLSGLDQFERHRDAGCPRPRSLGDALPEPHCREG
jgi:hypothetical protein